MIDAHVHLFDHKDNIYNYINDDYCDLKIGFMDTDFECLNKYSYKDTIRYYDNFINNYYNNQNTILLATGTSSKVMIDLYKKYPDIIKGFGEIKCYDYYKNISLPFGNLDWIYELCEFNKTKKLPIYLHYYVYDFNRYLQLDFLLNKYPTIPFVLCHAGLSFKQDYIIQFSYVTNLLSKHKNLYIDISYKPVEFFLSNKQYTQIYKDRALYGSDLNPKYFAEKNNNDYLKTFDTSNQVSVVKKLFNIKL